MLFSPFKTSYRHLVTGVDSLIPLFNGKQVRSINFDNAATTPPFVSVIEEINNFPRIILLYTVVLVINLVFRQKFMKTPDRL
ncbi:MAG: hypothetical protein WA131_00050 [Desulfitobacteriaceae bacterium]